MHDRVHIRAGFVDLAVDEALIVGASLAHGEGIAVEIIDREILAPHQAGRALGREHVHLRVLVVAHADMPEPVDNILVIEDVVGDDEIIEQRLIGLRHWLGH